MTKEPIMIDDVDVSGCQFFIDEYIEDFPDDGGVRICNFCCIAQGECETNKDCHYKQLKRKEEECEELREDIKDIADLLDLDTGEEYNFGNIEMAVKDLMQECEVWKKELDKTHLLMLKRQNELVKEILENDQLKAENEILEKDKANLDVIIETLKAQFKQLEKENVKLKELVKTRIEDLCDSCGASSMMPMPCKVYEQALQEIKKICKLAPKETNCDRCYTFGFPPEHELIKLIRQKCEVIDEM